MKRWTISFNWSGEIEDKKKISKAIQEVFHVVREDTPNFQDRKWEEELDGEAL